MSRRDRVSNQDYNLIKVSTKKVVEDLGGIYNFSEDSIGFLFLVLSKLFKRQEDEIIEDITDTLFLKNFQGQDSGPDRGVDACFIDDENKVIHIFNFKYTNKDLEKVKDINFKGAEVNEIIVFLKDLYEKNESGFSGNSANKRLEQKVKEIWRKQEDGVYDIKIHFVANLFCGLADQEEKRLVSDLENYGGEISFSYTLVRDISDVLTNRSKKINGKFRALSTNFFDKIEGGNRALILEMSVLDLLRITTKKSELRENVESEDRGEIFNADIEESLFDDNVRVYLKQRTNINKNIKKTALDEEERANIFFYNNGVTITCDEILYQGKRSPTITLKNFQIVNGGQTIHALRNAFDEDQSGFEDITILCRVYQTNNNDFKSKISEYTNSQNPVKDRDIRSIDLVQIKLGEDFKQLGYFYERKRGQYENEDKFKRVDSEKLGQALMAFNLEMPAEAKDKKRIIFGDKYEHVFNDTLLAEDALVIFNLYKLIEKKKLENKTTKPYLMYATYYIMFFIKKLSMLGDEENLIKYYDEAVEKIEHIIQKEKEKLKDNYLDSVLFKTNRPKDYLTELNL